MSAVVTVVFTPTAARREDFDTTNFWSTVPRGYNLQAILGEFRAGSNLDRPHRSLVR